MMIIAQITDLHIVPRGQLLQGRVDTARYLEQAVAKLLTLQPLPDVVLITGDLVENGRADEYRLLREIIAPLTMPVYVIPGNHDDRDVLRQEFADHSYLPCQGFLQYSIDDFPVRLIALDTVIPMCTEGELCRERLQWLEATLAQAPNKPALIFMHHPPFATGIPHMDNYGLVNPSPFAAIVEKHPQVQRIVCGHVHRAIQALFARTLALTCPGAAHQIYFDMADDAPAAFTFEPAGLMLHLWNGHSLATHTLYSSEHEGPILYR
jgi:3',5'-cyclic-AMP phosphodiesterase